MRSVMIPLIAAILLHAVSADLADARVRRPPKPPKHYRYSPEHLDRRLSAFPPGFERVTLVNEMETVVSRAGDVCRLEWTGRRVDLYLGDRDSLEIGVLVPADARLGDLELYRVAADGRTGREIPEEEVVAVAYPHLFTLRVAHDPDWPVVDVHYTFESETFGVDETFVFRQPWPTLRAQYTFGVQRRLWESAVAAGRSWELEALAHPRTWRPRRDDTADRFAWFWRKLDIDPEARGTPDSLTVSGLLPAPLLADLDSEELEKLLKQRRIRDVRGGIAFEFVPATSLRPFEHLRNQYEHSDPADYGLTVPTGPPPKGPRRSAPHPPPETT